MAERRSSYVASKNPKAMPKAESKPPQKKKKKFAAVKVDMYHPFQKVRIPTGSPGVELDRDSWLDSQIEAGLMKEV